MDVGEWLRSLGLAQFEATFRENGIDGEVLPELTEADLEKLGMLLGHRKRLLRAIAGLSASARSAPTAAVNSAPAADAAERRQLTVMFCDLVGSTALAARLDPEDVRSVIAAYHKCCATLIARAGGFVAKYMGDGVLAYFGYPQAHEHDAERAVRAGLAIAEAAPKLADVSRRAAACAGRDRDRDRGGRRSLRFGRGAGARGRRRHAEPRRAAATDCRARQSRHRGEHAQASGRSIRVGRSRPADLKGVAGSSRAFAALRESSQESRFDALHAGGLTPLVGREEESELLASSLGQGEGGPGPGQFCFRARRASASRA